MHIHSRCLSRSPLFLLVLAIVIMLSACGTATIATGPVHSIPPLSTSHPWLVILCKPNDVTTEPHPASYYQQLFTDTSADDENVPAYFAQQSHGTIDIAGTRVIGWFTVPGMTETTLQSSDRVATTQVCADAAEKDITTHKRPYHFTDFHQGGVIAVWNIAGVDSGAGSIGVEGGGRISEEGNLFGMVSSGANPALGGADPTTVSFYTHEMLHVFGLDHNHGPYPRSYSVDHKVDPITSYLETENTASFDPIYADEYGDCWFIMGCGLWTTASSPYTAMGPDLNAAQQDMLGWLPKSRILTYDRTSHIHVTLAPTTTPDKSGYLLIKVPLGSAGYYTIEYTVPSLWSKNLPVNGTVVIHEVRSSDSRATYLVGRTFLGNWMPGQIFHDPINHLWVSIDSLGDAASLTLAPDGPDDDGRYVCPSSSPTSGYISPYAPTVTIASPYADAHVTTGTPITFSANVQDLNGALSSIPDADIVWSVKGGVIGTGSKLSYTFSKPEDVTATVTVLGRSCLTASAQVTLHVQTALPLPPGSAALLSLSPTTGTAYCLNGQYPDITVKNSGQASLIWQATTSQGITITPSQGTLTSDAMQIVHLSGMPAQPPPTLQVTFTSNGGNGHVTFTCH